MQWPPSHEQTRRAVDYGRLRLSPRFEVFLDRIPVVVRRHLEHAEQIAELMVAGGVVVGIAERNRAEPLSQAPHGDGAAGHEHAREGRAALFPHLPNSGGGAQGTVV